MWLSSTNSTTSLPRNASIPKYNRERVTDERVVDSKIFIVDIQSVQTSTFSRLVRATYQFTC